MNSNITIGEQRALLECALNNLDTIQEMNNAVKRYAARKNNGAVQECFRVKREASEMYAKTLQLLVKVHIENAMPFADITVNENHAVMVNNLLG